jgi:hypothetical protein
LPPSWRSSHRARRRFAESVLGPAAELCRASSVDARRFVTAWVSTLNDDQSGAPQDEFMLNFAIRLLSESAIDDALEQRSGEAIELLRTAWAGCARLSGIPMVWRSGCWPSMQCSVLLALRRILPLLPPDVDPDFLGARPDPEAERSAWMRALVVQRAVGNQVFALIYEPLHHSSIGEYVRTIPFRIVHSRDHLKYLQAFEEALPAFQRPWWERKALPPYPPPGDIRFALLTNMLGPDFPDLSNMIATAEAHACLTRTALAIRREGSKAAGGIVSVSIDPFTGQPLHFRVEPDGTLVLWSVGSDGIDNGAPNDPSAEASDIVWRWRAR